MQDTISQSLKLNHLLPTLDYPNKSQGANKTVRRIQDEALSTQIVQRKAHELSSFEKEEIICLIKRYYPNADNEYIKARISEDCQNDIVLLKNSMSVLGVGYYSINQLKTPFSSKIIPVVQFGQALKKESYRKSVIWKLGHWYAQRNISYLYPLKKVMGISLIKNPKVYEHFTKLFPNHYPRTKSSHTNSNLIAFLNAYFNENKKLNISIEEDFCFYVEGFKIEDITQDWEKHYKAKDETINELFIKSEAIEFKNGKIYQTKKALVACGYRNPLKYKSLKSEILVNLFRE